jgi:AAA15 family ATPase/GTPase
MIKEIHINNFKSIKDLNIHCNDNFNAIIGENNIGKTTIFEAIHLWKICYDSNIQKSNKSKFYASSNNISFTEKEYLRAFEDQDLINTELYSENKDILITISIELNGRVFELGLQISKVLSVDNAYLQVSYINKESFWEFSEEVKSTQYNLTNIIIICESRPVANIVAKEPYMYKNQVLDKISRGKGYEVLRNKVTKSQSHNNIKKK